MSLPRPVLLGLAALAVLLFVPLGLGLGFGGAPFPGRDPAPAATAPTAPAASAKAASTPRPPAAPADLSLPEPVARALAQRRVVVLLLFQGRSADDAATRAAVDELARRPPPGVEVFSERIERVARYRSLVEDLSVSQTPAVVIVDRERRARVVEGFVDAGSLRQDAVDATS
jgi:hypothetical protein